jgi:hypothetical protein
LVSVLAESLSINKNAPPSKHNEMITPTTETIKTLRRPAFSIIAIGIKVQIKLTPEVPTEIQIVC